MKRFKKFCRIIWFILLILLASLGIGLGGGAPVIPIRRREDNITVKIELVEPKKDKSKVAMLNVKSG